MQVCLLYAKWSGKDEIQEQEDLGSNSQHGANIPSPTFWLRGVPETGAPLKDVSPGLTVSTMDTGSLLPLSVLGLSEE